MAADNRSAAPPCYIVYSEVVKLLFDENLSPSLVASLSSDFPGSAHVADVGLASAHDSDVWRYAREHGYVVVSKDVDFVDLAVELRSPPKVVCVAIGNCRTAEVAALLTSHLETLRRFAEDGEKGVLTLFRA